MGFLYSQFFVTPPYPTHDFTSQVIIVTGSNVGLGFQAAHHFVRLNASKVILAVRNTAAGKEAKELIESDTGRTDVCEVWPLDLASYDSVKSFAKRASGLPRLDTVVENAGIATDKFSTAEGEEKTITVNVISTILLAILLLPKLRSTAQQTKIASHLTIITSERHEATNLPEWKSDRIFETLSNEKTADMGPRYSTSKLLEVLCVREMAPLINSSEVILNMVNPGLCHSELGREMGFAFTLIKMILARTTEVGSRTLVHGAMAGAESHGQYLSDSSVAEVSAFVRSEDGKKAQTKVWEELKQKLNLIQPGIMANFK